MMSGGGSIPHRPTSMVFSFKHLTLVWFMLSRIQSHWAGTHCDIFSATIGFYTEALNVLKKLKR